MTGLTEAEIRFNDMERATHLLQGAAREYASEWAKSAPETSMKQWCEVSDGLEAAAMEFARAKHRWEQR